MYSELTFLFSGIVFGLSAGLSPGPLQMLVVSETLRHGIRAGLKVAVAPLLTDLPIVLATLFIIFRLSSISPVIGLVSILGGMYLFYLGIESFSFKDMRGSDDEVKAKSIQKGMITNFLNPAPYLFWFSIGSPTVIKASKIGVLPVVFFLFGIYFFLIASKMMLAFLTGKSGRFLKSTMYLYVIRFLGVVLILFACRFFFEGFKHLGIVS